MIEARYAIMLSTFFVCLLLSFGMPMFYFVGFASFFITFIIDKYLCKFKCNLSNIVLRYYKLPPYGDKLLASVVRNIMTVALFFHLVISFMMISNNNMFKCLGITISYSQFEAIVSKIILQIPFISIIFNPDRFTTDYEVLMFIFMIASLVSVILFLVFGTVVFSCLSHLRRSCIRCRNKCCKNSC